MSEQRVFATLTAIVLVATHASFAGGGEPPSCSGPSAFLAVIDRPTTEDSGCVLPQGKADIEAGVSEGNLYPAPGGSIYMLPNLTLRWGLPDEAELVWLPPSLQYLFVRQGPGSPALRIRGAGPTTIGIKHVLGFTGHWQWTAEALATPPSGDGVSGSHGLGGALNAIVSYGNGRLGASLMVGATSQTGSTEAGGQRFQSFNPDLVLTWASSSRLQIFAEIYAQSHAGFQQGWGTNVDGGLQYLAASHLVLDLEEGARIQGELGGFSNYTGVGFGLMF